MIPKYCDLYNPILEYMNDGNIRALKDIRSHIAVVCQLTEEELQLRTDRGTLIYNDRLSWAVKYLFHAGLLERVNRGRYHTTDLGRSTLQDNLNGITNETLLQFDSFRSFVQRGSAQTSSPVQENIASPLSPIENIEESIAIINDSLANELLDIIKEKDPTFFEHLVVDLLMKMGYGRLQHGSSLVTPPTNDHGIDGIINEDKLGLSKIYIQAKRYTEGNVSGPTMQQFIGAMSGKVTKGVFITTTDFSNSAKDYAQSSNVNIALINGTKLTELMIEFNLGVTVEKTYDIKAINSDYFSEQL